MRKPKIIRTDDAYRSCLAEVDRLAANDPASGTADGDRLQFFATLVEDYEKMRFPFNRPAASQSDCHTRRAAKVKSR